mmetsp:Transcript_30912/g.42838  ORF Transcript_30912/g.42838 Transcript_30912/m.42838 type:complete len:234 (+) Transcript_30912:283-984(+)|eukprot:CAMPEP_0196581440 /NCGR_PEP_ID=MMETSP1081-20130531/33962_1 /TAXON_ID=36882 /ORGANISM="Pyramimonas amylifera, Strain CCMP720" /LENGTH=233 /DNA_ID=CAMNT_0041901673 /DNA_START=279 /DNA_END=980 /DNA_ORIENTATION=+
MDPSSYPEGAMYSLESTIPPSDMQIMTIAPDSKKTGASTEERTLRAIKSPNLFAFNQFAMTLRAELRAGCTMSGAEVEKEIGARWAGMDSCERSARVEAARQEQTRLLAMCPTDHNGHPLLDPHLFFGGSGKKRKKYKGTGLRNNDLRRTAFTDMTGLRFDAVVDGEFDVGYFFTAKAREPGHGILRGILFKTEQKMGEVSIEPPMPQLTMNYDFQGPLDAVMHIPSILDVNQ